MSAVMDDVVDGLGGFGACPSVRPAPPAPLPRQVFTPYIQESFYGVDVGKILARLGTMGDGLNRGISLPVQLSPAGRADFNVVEASPVLNARQWTLLHWVLQRFHRFALKISRSTKFFVAQSITAFPLLGGVKRGVARYGTMVKQTVHKLFTPLRLLWGLMKWTATAIFDVFTWYYRRFAKQIPVLAWMSKYLVMWFPTNLKYTMPYEREGLSQNGLLLINVGWVAFWAVPVLGTAFFAVIPGIALFVPALAVNFAGIAAGFFTGFWAVAIVLALGVAFYFLVIAGGAFGTFVGGIVSFIAPYIGWPLGTTILAIAGIVIIPATIIVTIIGMNVGAFLTFWATYLPFLGLALVIAAAAAGILAAGIALGVFLIGTLLFVPVLSILVLIPLYVSHYLICCVRRYEVETFGTFSSPYYSDIRKVV